MAEPFDPYHKWLGIAPKDQPPNHYRLLGIELFEADADVIDAAANRVSAYLEGCNQGAHLPQLQKLLEAVTAARRCLLDAGQKAQYDAELQRKTGQPKGQRGQSGPRKGTTPPARTQAPPEGGLELDLGSRPPAEKSQPAAKAPKAGKRKVAARSWKEYALWLSPALVLLVAAGIYFATRGPKGPAVVKQVQQRPVFNRPEDIQAGAEPVSLKSLGTALDDNSAELRGTWLAQQDIRDKYVGRYYQVAKSGDHVAKFDVPSGATGGAFEVRMSYVPTRDRATNVKVQVFPADGKPVTVTVNQQKPPAIDGLFHSLGTFTFQGGKDERIEISAQGADGTVVADAVQFIRAAGKK